MRVSRHLKATVERFRKGECSAHEILSGIFELVILMATKQDLADAVNTLVAADTVNKATIAAKDKQIADLTAQLAAAGNIDDTIIASINGVSADLNPPTGQ